MTPYLWRALALSLVVVGLEFSISLGFCWDGLMTFGALRSSLEDFVLGCLGFLLFNVRSFLLAFLWLLSRPSVFWVDLSLCCILYVLET